MIAMWSARADDLIADKVPLELVWNGAENYQANLLVPKGNPNAKADVGIAGFVAQASRRRTSRCCCPTGRPIPARAP